MPSCSAHPKPSTHSLAQQSPAGNQLALALKAMPVLRPDTAAQLKAKGTAGSQKRGRACDAYISSQAGGKRTFAEAQASQPQRQPSAAQSLTASAPVSDVVDLCDSLEAQPRPQVQHSAAPAAPSPKQPGSQAQAASAHPAGCAGAVPAGACPSQDTLLASTQQLTQGAGTASHERILETQSQELATQVPDASAAAHQALLGTQGASTASQPGELQAEGSAGDATPQGGVRRDRTKATRLARLSASQLTAASCSPAGAEAARGAASVTQLPAPDSQASVAHAVTRSQEAVTPSLQQCQAYAPVKLADVGGPHSEENADDVIPAPSAAVPAPEAMPSTHVLSTHDMNGSKAAAGGTGVAKRAAPPVAATASAAKRAAVDALLPPRPKAAAAANGSAAALRSSADAQSDMVAMGFAPAQVAVALKVCRGNQERAIEYLLSK